MTGIHPPDKTWAQRARVALFGVDFRGREAVFTPFAAAYRVLAGNAVAHGGWWPAATDSDVLVAHVPQGSPMLDAVYALPAGTGVTFIGLAGSLRGDPTGTVVEPTTASVVWPGRDCGQDPADPGPSTTPRSHPAPLIGVAARAVSVGCLAQSTQQHDHLTRHADCVDLETGPLFEAAASCGHPVRSLLVISDTNRDGAAFASDPVDTRNVLEAVCDTVRSAATAAVSDHG